MTCTRKNVLWRSGRNFNSINTKILAPQTATVVGPSGPDSIHTDQYGRIRVQFHWDRIGNSDERSSAWVRVFDSLRACVRASRRRHCHIQLAPATPGWPTHGRLRLPCVLTRARQRR